MAVAVIGLTFLGKVDAKDFIMLASMAFSFYFASKGDPNEPFAGKWLKRPLFNGVAFWLQGRKLCAL